MLCIPLGVCSPSLSQGRAECAAVPPGAPQPLYSPLLGLAAGVAGPALAQRSSAATRAGRRTRSRCSQGVPAWSPGEEKCPSPRLLLRCCRADRRKFHNSIFPAHTGVQTQTLCADQAPCAHSAPGEMPPCPGRIPEKPLMPHELVKQGKDQGEADVSTLSSLDRMLEILVQSSLEHL